MDGGRGKKLADEDGVISSPARKISRMRMVHMASHADDSITTSVPRTIQHLLGSPSVHQVEGSPFDAVFVNGLNSISPANCYDAYLDCQTLYARTPTSAELHIDGMFSIATSEHAPELDPSTGLSDLTANQTIGQTSTAASNSAGCSHQAPGSLSAAGSYDHAFSNDYIAPPISSDENRCTSFSNPCNIFADAHPNPASTMFAPPTSSFNPAPHRINPPPIYYEDFAAQLRPEEVFLPFLECVQNDPSLGFNVLKNHASPEHADTHSTVIESNEPQFADHLAHVFDGEYRRTRSRGPTSPPPAPSKKKRLDFGDPPK
ncbi:hypothetical protein ACP70R_045037 [Stipagrostis hirtigluma subsp. patula]